ncbi:MAG: GntR family transcriptional regulator [Deltaproteobacteria bacterium]|nr:GntR family transcriptional regulator [Deltaproteobacteria bacterium]
MQKIHATTLHQEIVSRIRKMIQKGILVRGQKVSEKDLCESMGVSRTPVREALRQLTSEGLIQLIPHKGAFVSQPCIEEISDLFEVMGVLEGACARLAVIRMKERDLQKIEALHEVLESHFRNRDHEAYLKTNHIIHAFIQELTGNRVLNDLINGLRQKILLYRQRQLYQPERFDQSIQEHRNLIGAFRTRDSDSAESLMKHHLLMQCKALVGLYASKEAEEGKVAAAR